MGPQVSPAHTLLVNLKHMCWYLNHRKRKEKVDQRVSRGNQPGFLKQRGRDGVAGSSRGGEHGARGRIRLEKSLGLALPRHRQAGLEIQ